MKRPWVVHPLLLGLFPVLFLFGRNMERLALAQIALPAIVVLLAALVLAIIAPILARLIQLAVSRQREFLADAEAARMTRYPEGLASALEALAADTHEMPQAHGANAHLFIHEPRMARGRRKSHGSLWSSHPPIEERVARLRSIGNIEA